MSASQSKERYDQSVKILKVQCAQDVKEFKAGQLSQHLAFWKFLTSDPEVLDIIIGMKIHLESQVYQGFIPNPISFGQKETILIQKEIEKMLNKGIIVPVSNEPLEGEYISNIFTRPKKDGGLRIILNLRGFNKQVCNSHFKMHTLQNAIDLMSPKAYMASIDFKDAYYSVRIDDKCQKYLRFFFQGQKYAFSCLPNGLSTGPRKFTKVAKVLFAYLRVKKRHINSHYIDDSFLLALTEIACRQNIIDTLNASRKAGFVVHPEKSVLIPVQVLVYLGFVLNTLNMTVTLTQQKKDKLIALIDQAISKPNMTIQQLAELVGNLVGTFPGMRYGKLYYRQLDNEKNFALSINKGDFSKELLLTNAAISDLKWWKHNLNLEFASATIPIPDIVLATDASNTGWGGTDNFNSTKGHWTLEENDYHINVKELLAVRYSLESLYDSIRDKTIKVMSDNTTTVNYINQQGGKKTLCNCVTKQIWLWAIKRNIWLLATYIPGLLNSKADKLSRASNPNIEWKISARIFHKIELKFGKRDIDLFASRTNACTDIYVSWFPDPGAKFCDAFSISWDKCIAYAFPPFVLLSRVLRKIEQQSDINIVLIAPEWPTQSWFSKLMMMANDFFYFSNAELTNPHPVTPPKGRLMALHIKKNSKEKVFN